MNLSTLPNLMNRIHVLLIMSDLADPQTVSLCQQLTTEGALVDQVWIEQGEWELNGTLHHVLQGDRECVMLLDAAVGVSRLDFQALHQASLNEDKPVSAITGTSRVALDAYRLKGSTELAEDTNARGYVTPLRFLGVSLDVLAAQAARLPKVDGVPVFFQAAIADGQVLSPYDWFCRLWGGVTLMGRMLPTRCVERRYPEQLLVDRLMREADQREQAESSEPKPEETLEERS